jgi:hypothetical protein
MDSWLCGYLLAAPTTSSAAASSDGDAERPARELKNALNSVQAQLSATRELIQQTAIDVTRIEQGDRRKWSARQPASQACGDDLTDALPSGCIGAQPRSRQGALAWMISSRCPGGRTLTSAVGADVLAAFTKPSALPW